MKASFVAGAAGAAGCFACFKGVCKTQVAPAPPLPAQDDDLRRIDERQLQEALDESVNATMERTLSPVTLAGEPRSRLSSEEQLQLAIEASLADRFAVQRTYSAKFSTSECVNDGPFAPTADLWSMASKIEGVTTYEQQREFAESFEEMLPVFGVQVPADRCMQLGPAGLDLWSSYHMQAVAIERPNGLEGSAMIDFNVGPDATLTSEDMLWFGIGGGPRVSVPGKVLIPRGLQHECVAGLEMFLTSADFTSVKIGQMPVIGISVPDQWFGQLLGDLNLLRHGINVCALRKAVSGNSHFFPSLDMRLESGDKIFLESVSAKKLVALRKTL